MDRALSPVKGKVRRILDGADRHVHLIEMAHTDCGFKHVGVFVTMGSHLLCINEDLQKLEMLPDINLSVAEDYFPEMIIAKLRKEFKNSMDITDIKYQTHAAAIRPASAADINQGQE
jgi:hypothetical protein